MTFKFQEMAMKSTIGFKMSSNIYATFYICNISIWLCIFTDLNVTADQQFDALLMSNVVPMFPEFRSKLQFDTTTNPEAHLNDIFFFFLV